VTRPRPLRRAKAVARRSSSEAESDPQETLAESKSRNAAVSCDAEVCYAFGWEAREALAVKRRAFITLLGGAA
jgi:hypothetical protein